jgi:hypothetical protein
MTRSNLYNSGQMFKVLRSVQANNLKFLQGPKILRV